MEKKNLEKNDNNEQTNPEKQTKHVHSENCGCQKSAQNTIKPNAKHSHDHHNHKEHIHEKPSLKKNEKVEKKNEKDDSKKDKSHKQVEKHHHKHDENCGCNHEKSNQKKHHHHHHKHGDGCGCGSEHPPAEKVETFEQLNRYEKKAFNVQVQNTHEFFFQNIHMKFRRMCQLTQYFHKLITDVYPQTEILKRIGKKGKEKDIVHAKRQIIDVHMSIERVFRENILKEENPLIKSSFMSLRMRLFPLITCPMCNHPHHKSQNFQSKFLSYENEMTLNLKQKLIDLSESIVKYATQNTPSNLNVYKKELALISMGIKNEKSVKHKIFCSKCLTLTVETIERHVVKRSIFFRKIIKVMKSGNGNELKKIVLNEGEDSFERNIFFSMLLSYVWRSLFIRGFKKAKNEDDEDAKGRSMFQVLVMLNKFKIIVKTYATALLAFESTEKFVSKDVKKKLLHGLCNNKSLFDNHLSQELANDVVNVDVYQVSSQNLKDLKRIILRHFKISEGEEGSVKENFFEKFVSDLVSDYGKYSFCSNMRTFYDKKLPEKKAFFVFAFKCLFVFQTKPRDGGDKSVFTTEYFKKCPIPLLQMFVKMYFMRAHNNLDLQKREKEFIEMHQTKRNKKQSIYCARVGCKEVGELVCSRCKSSRYCSRECQKKDWKTHKKNCKKMKK